MAEVARQTYETSCTIYRSFYKSADDELKFSTSKNVGTNAR